MSVHVDEAQKERSTLEGVGLFSKGGESFLSFFFFFLCYWRKGSAAGQDFSAASARRVLICGRGVSFPLRTAARHQGVLGDSGDAEGC